MAFELSGSVIIDDSRNVVAGSAATFTGNITANGNIVGDNSTNISGISSVTATALYGTTIAPASGAITIQSGPDNGRVNITSAEYLVLDVAQMCKINSEQATEIQVPTLEVKNQADNETMAKFTQNGACRLYYDNAEKIKTTSGGVEVTGTVAATSYTGDGSSLTGIGGTEYIHAQTLAVAGVSTFTDDVTFTGASYNLQWDKSQDSLEFADNTKATFGANRDLIIESNGSNSFIDEYGSSGKLLIRSNNQVDITSTSNASMIEMVVGGAVNLYHDGSKKAETTSNGFTVTGGLTASGTSNSSITASGTNSNVTLTSSGTNSNINLYSTGSNAQLKLEANNTDNSGFLHIDADTGVDLFYGGGFANQKLATTTHGIDVTGHVETDTLRVSGISTFSGTISGGMTINGGNVDITDNNKIRLGSSNIMQMNQSGSNSFLEHTSASGTFYIQGDTLRLTNKDRDETYIECDDEAGVKLNYANTTKIETTSAGVTVTGDLTVTGTAPGGLGVGQTYVNLESLGSAANNGNNTFVGYNAGASLSGADHSTFFGYQAGKAALNAGNNTFFGASSGEAATGGDNTGFGQATLQSVVASSSNTAVGRRALTSVTTSENTAVGADCLRYQSSGSKNTAVGRGAAEHLGTSDYSIAIGFEALRGAGAGAGQTVTGASNIAIGANAGDALTSGSQNICIGQNAFTAATDKHWNVIIGKDCNDSNGGNGNVILGHDAGRSTSGGYNVVIGKAAGDVSSFSGDNNIIIGYNADPTAAATDNEITLGNTDITKFRIPGLNFVIKDSTATEDYVLTVDASGEAGWEAAGSSLPTGEGLLKAKNSSGSASNSGSNIYGGSSAGSALASGANENTFVGVEAGRYCSTGDNNTFYGAHAGENVDTTSGNVAIGQDAFRNGTGSTNIIIGQGAADLGSFTGSNNIVIGKDADPTSASTSNEITLGNSSTNTFRIPALNYLHNSTGVGIGTTNPQGILHLQSNNPAIKIQDTNQTADNRNWNISAGNGHKLRIQALNDSWSGGSQYFDFYRDGNKVKEFRGVKNSDPWFTINNTDQEVGIGTTNTSAMLDVGNAGIATADTVINAQAWDGQVFSVDGNITSDSVFAVNDISGLPVLDFNATHGNIALAPFGNNVSIGYTNAGTKLGLKGSTSERVYIVADELSDQTSDTINIDNGNVQYFTTAEDGGTLTANITSNNGINNDLAIGDSTTVVVIIKPDSSSDKITNITIDGGAATEEWLGGSAPDGGASGSYDVYTFFILKTADATFLPLCNKVNFA